MFKIPLRQEKYRRKSGVHLRIPERTLTRPQHSLSSKTLAILLPVFGIGAWITQFNNKFPRVSTCNGNNFQVSSWSVDVKNMDSMMKRLFTTNTMQVWGQLCRSFCPTADRDKMNGQNGGQNGGPLRWMKMDEFLYLIDTQLIRIQSLVWAHASYSAKTLFAFRTPLKTSERQKQLLFPHAFCSQMFSISASEWVMSKTPHSSVSLWLSHTGSLAHSICH